MSLNVITADIPFKDDCPVLTRLKAFVVKAGLVTTLEHVFRDSHGRPLDISEHFPQQGDQGRLVLRSKEIVSNVGGNNPMLEFEGYPVRPESGVVRFDLDEQTTVQPGVYQLSIMLTDSQDRGLVIDNPLLWVEPSLFANNPYSGVPSLQEIRQFIMDSHEAENLLLNDVEFSLDQITYALTLPIHDWNTTPPPLYPLMDTRTFPFTRAWLGAIAGYLFGFAAHNYRRNHLPYQAGGVAIDDKNKEATYQRASAELLAEWKMFVITKKYEINTKSLIAHVGSPYA